MRHLKDFAFIEGVMNAGSIRKAAEDMNITASALNRRINRFEDEFGFEIFERLPRGVRLNPAGELLIQHIRAQRSDFAHLKSQVADLAGVRRGHVSIACSQALLPHFIPRQIARYRLEHPGVTFSVNARDRVAAEQELSDFTCDIALVFEPRTMVDFELIRTIAQPIQVIMQADHPLAAQETVRLRDALQYPHVAPSDKFAVRVLMENAARRLLAVELNPVIESDSFDFMCHYCEWENTISFQFPIGLDMERVPNLVARPLSERDVAPGNLLLGQQRGRTLPVASAMFMRELALEL